MKPVERTFAVAMVAAPILLLAATGIFAADGSFYESRAGGAVQFVAMGVMALAIAGLTRLIEGDLPRAAAVAAVVGHLGVTAGAGFGIERMFTAMGSPALDAAGAAVPLYPIGTLFPLGMVIFGVCLARAPRADWPRWAGYALAVGGVLFPLSRIPGITSLGLLADALIAVGLVPVGLWALGARTERVRGEYAAA